MEYSQNFRYINWDNLFEIFYINMWFDLYVYFWLLLCKICRQSCKPVSDDDCQSLLMFSIPQSKFHAFKPFKQYPKDFLDEALCYHQTRLSGAYQVFRIQTSLWILLAALIPPRAAPQSSVCFWKLPCPHAFVLYVQY